MSVFQDVAPWDTIFTWSCVISLRDSAQSPSGKELKLSSLEQWCFSELKFLLMFSHYLVCALFALVLTHITYWIHMWIYTICGLFLQRKTTSIQNILFCALSFFLFIFFFFWRNIRKQYYDLPQERLWLHNSYYKGNMKF